MDPTYRFPAVVTAVHDGDNITADVNLQGFGAWIHGVEFRLLGCNARELVDPGGPEAHEHLSGLVLGVKVALTSVKPDKYGGRMLAVVTLPDGSDLVSGLIAEGWAAPWNGRGVKPLPPWPRPVPP